LHASEPISRSFGPFDLSRIILAITASEGDRMKLRIGYYDDSKVNGGTTRYLFDLLNGLDREEFEPIFFAPVDYPWHEGLREVGVKVVTPTKGRATPPAATAAPVAPRKAGKRPRLPKSLAWHVGLASELRNAYRLFKSERVDLFHSNNVGAEPAPIAAHWTGKPVVGTLHVDPTYDLFGERSSWRYRNLEKWCLRSLDHAIADSRSTFDLWSTHCRLPDAYRSARMSLIYYGIDASRLARRRESRVAKRSLGLPDDAFVIVSLGRLEPAKGYEGLIRALPAIVQAVPSVQVVIGGQGFLKENLLRLAESLGVKQRVQLLGFKDDVRDVLEAGDIYVQPSLCEALGYGLLEALTMELPAVITNVGGMPEIVESGSNGLVVPAKRPEALAAAVATLAKDHSIRRRFGAVGRMRVQAAFSMANMREVTFDLYRRIVRARMGPTSSAQAG
jgi:glycosyltransferase involved in cell wall biosynthesis